MDRAPLPRWEVLLMGQIPRHANHAQRQAAYRLRQAEALQAHLRARSLPPLPAVSNQPGHRRWAALLQLARWALQTVNDEMQNYYDDRSETWQEDERGEDFNERISLVEQALETLHELAPPTATSGGDR